MNAVFVAFVTTSLNVFPTVGGNGHSQSQSIHFVCCCWPIVAATPQCSYIVIGQVNNDCQYNYAHFVKVNVILPYVWFVVGIVIND